MNKATTSSGEPFRQSRMSHERSTCRLCYCQKKQFDNDSGTGHCEILSASQRTLNKMAVATIQADLQTSPPEQSSTKEAKLDRVDRRKKSDVTKEQTKQHPSIILHQCGILSSQPKQNVGLRQETLWDEEKSALQARCTIPKQAKQNIESPNHSSTMPPLYCPVAIAS